MLGYHAMHSGHHMLYDGGIVLLPTAPTVPSVPTVPTLPTVSSYGPLPTAPTAFLTQPQKVRESLRTRLTHYV